MSMQQKAIIGAIVIASFVFFNAKPKEALTNDQVQPIIEQTEKAFAEAESKIFVNPVNPDVIPGPDPDPAKCACKGTGKIVHGDGHTTDCPYHGKSVSKKNCKDKDCTPEQIRMKTYVPQRRGLFFRK